MKLLLGILMSLSSFSALAGNFSIVYGQSRGANNIKFEGPIVSGDTSRFIQFIKQHPTEVMQASYLELNSPGGSVLEALRLSNQIEKSGFMVVVKDNQTCASACFLLFTAGQFRVMNRYSDVLLHRPYIDNPRHDLSGYETDRKAQQISAKALRDYLEERSVSSSLIDIMMNYPSSNAHKLTESELHDDVKIMTPTLEELTIKRCGLTNQNIFTSDRVFSGNPETDDLHCIRHFLIGLKLEYVESIVGKKRAHDAFDEMKSNSNL